MIELTRDLGHCNRQLKTKITPPRVWHSKVLNFYREKGPSSSFSLLKYDNVNFSVIEKKKLLSRLKGQPYIEHSTFFLTIFLDTYYYYYSMILTVRIRSHSGPSGAEPILIFLILRIKYKCTWHG